MVLRFWLCVVEVSSLKTATVLPAKRRSSATLATTRRASFTSSMKPDAPRTYLPWPLLIAIFMVYRTFFEQFVELGLGETLLNQLVNDGILCRIARGGANVELVRGVSDGADENHIHQDQRQTYRLAF